jgi:hypothetical protein
MQGSNVVGVGRRDAQTHRRHKMSSLVRGRHPKSDGLNALLAK